MENKQESSMLSTEKIGALMRKYAIPCIILLLVGALYNSVDQIFIANASYLGSYGNAANTVVYPLTVIALVIFFGLDGVLMSMPVSDVLTAVLSAIIIAATYRELSRGAHKAA